MLHLAATPLPQIDGIVYNSPKYRNDHSEQPTAQAADQYNVAQFLIWFSEYFISHDKPCETLRTGWKPYRGHINFMKFRCFFSTQPQRILTFFMDI